MVRILYLDGIPLGVTLPGLQQVVSRAEIDSLYQSVFLLQDPPDLVLDCRGLSSSLFNQLLKFIEEYRGGITMIARDPVLPPILSRFIDVRKNFKPTPGNLISLRLRKAPESIKSKLESLFGLVSDTD